MGGVLMAKPTGYPAVFVWELADFLETEIPSLKGVVRRPLRPTDPNPSVGVVAATWKPGERVIGQQQPLINIYDLEVHLLYKHTNEEEGLEYHSSLTKTIRRMLYESTDIPVRLAANTEDLFGNKERFHRLKVIGQKFLANEVKGQFLFFSVTDLTIETENS
jgi:hypothetical protein